MNKKKVDKLVLGGTGKNEEDAITIDNEPAKKPDVIHDLQDVPWPFDDNEFKEVIAHHVLEHLDDLMPVMNELHRVCDPEGTIYIEVPHHSFIYANSPTHKLRFNAFAFYGWIDGEGEDSWKKGVKFTMLKRQITFHRAFRRYGLQTLFNKFPKTYERFWTYMIPAEHLKIWLRPKK